jgi:hypothetical protein
MSTSTHNHPASTTEPNLVFQPGFVTCRSTQGQNSATGSREAGRYSDCRKAWLSKNGAIVTSAATTKIATSDVDHGQRKRNQDEEKIRGLGPGGSMPQPSSQQRAQRIACDRAQAFPPRARSTSKMVLKPGTTSKGLQSCECQHATRNAFG